MPQYFGSTYEFERVRYNLGIFKATAGANDITDMFADFGYSLDSTDVEIDKFLFPKEIYMMFNSSQIKFPAIGGTVDLTYIVEEKSTDQIELQGGYGANRIIGTFRLSFNNFSK